MAYIETSAALSISISKAFLAVDWDNNLEFWEQSEQEAKESIFFWQIIPVKMKRKNYECCFWERLPCI